MPGRDRIYTCGEKEYLAWKERATRGLALDSVIQHQICTMRDELGLSYVFPFESP
jgi:L-2-hydroxycarboxylate dehydrogenase (NAD+)